MKRGEPDESGVFVARKMSVMLNVGISELPTEHKVEQWGNRLRWLVVAVIATESH